MIRLDRPRFSLCRVASLESVLIIKKKTIYKYQASRAILIILILIKCRLLKKFQKYTLKYRDRLNRQIKIVKLGEYYTNFKTMFSVPIA